jgi:calcineurin-like phosphoesterase family protein
MKFQEWDIGSAMLRRLAGQWAFREASVRAGGVATGSATVPDRQRIYAIGDIHGRCDLASKMIAMIRADLAESGNGLEVTAVGLGDFIDRGPQTRQVLDLLCVLREDASFRFEGIQGNHEAMFVSLLDRPGASLKEWLSFGGAETLTSYGISGAGRMTPVALREEISRRMPLEHLLFLQGLKLSETIGDYFFCHAGARPGVPLSRQDKRDLLWIGAGFSDRDAAFEKVIVHGHTRTIAAEIHRHRISLDTGAYATGVLSCAVLEGSGIRLLKCSQ